MRLAGLALLVASALHAQDRATIAAVDEAFQLAGVRGMLASLPSHANEMTASALAQLPIDRREQITPAIKEVSRELLDPDAFYRQLRIYFARHYDGAKMATFLALERTSPYRSMHRLEMAADAPGTEAARRRFEENLKADPPPASRVALLQRLDEATNSASLQVRIVTAILNATAAGMGAQMPDNLNAQSTAFTGKVQPVLASQVLLRNLYTYRNADDADLEDYIANAHQPSVEWFNRNLQAAIVAVAADRASQAGDAIKTSMAHRDR